MSENCFSKCPEIERVEEWIGAAAEYGGIVAEYRAQDVAYLEVFKLGCDDCPGSREVVQETALSFPLIRRFIGKPVTRQVAYLQCPRDVNGIETAPDINKT
jgi:hypothetical protein